MFMLNNKPLPLDTPFKTEDGTSFPANWLRLTTIQEKNAIGITEVPDPVPEPVVTPDPEPEVSGE